MRTEVLDFIQQDSFPCIMAKAVARKGHIDIHEVPDIKNPAAVLPIMEKLYAFVDQFRQNQEKLSSFMLVVKDESLGNFETFGKNFYDFLQLLHHEDKKLYPHDPRVARSVKEKNFSYSIKSEAFFIIALHPQSPRWARRFRYPAIVFNPHVQFERLRENKIYTKIRNIIRNRDKMLQGSINPMLNDFGERSEVFQYLGKVYQPHESVPLLL